ncbi:sigma-B regulation protein RsbU (phosphoserine phosphatase) [Pseudorhizobium tarimense]|uniref:histidine kinase n=1 Tax=Pseudorhizobium tarimense TaxID=1079109 RepID=A0ABV2HEE5_9HYPH|nr:PAS domain-containing sensor histidine kinase [Pseudorhizobium tarimense]MCJ8521871.1 PAS domain-containing sensor histidine kinase [Pseudorhizobium tarimense]
MEDLEDLYENAPCGYLSLAADGVIVKANRTLAGWLGTQSFELLGKRFYDLLNVPGKIFYETHFAPLLRMQGYFNEVALDLVGPDGRRLPVLANAAERRTSEGGVQFTRITLFQAADRRRYERELVDAKNTADRARKELEELNKSLEERIAAGVAERLQLEQGLLAEKEVARLREQFVAILGHDLRNPLASIVGGLNILSREPQSDKARRVLTMMSQSTERMSGLIQDMLDLARCRAGQGIAIVPKPTDLRAVLEQVVEELRAAHPGRDIQSSLQIEGPVPCDGGRIAQLVSNLLGNALTHGAPDRPVKVTATTDFNEVVITVANEGEPIPDHVKDHLFEPFFRATSSGEKQGLGLGLFISYEIARSHGGNLQVRSDQKETQFCFTMPIGG